MKTSTHHKHGSKVAPILESSLLSHSCDKHSPHDEAIALELRDEMQSLLGVIAQNTDEIEAAGHRIEAIGEMRCGCGCDRGLVEWIEDREEGGRKRKNTVFYYIYSLNPRLIWY